VEKAEIQNLMNQNNGMTMSRIAFLAIITLALAACSRHRADGDWDDIIKLSSKSFEFNSKGDSVIVKTGGSWWWVTDISVGNSWYYGFSDINLESDNYIIRHDCLVVEKRDKNTLFIRATANTDSLDRVITVGLEAGDYFDRIVVTQKAADN
jgi:hypothetical protein